MLTKFKSNLDNQEHLLVCEKQAIKQLVQQVLVFDDLLNGADPNQIQIAAVMEANFKLRKVSEKLSPCIEPSEPHLFSGIMIYGLDWINK